MKRCVSACRSNDDVHKPKRHVHPHDRMVRAIATDEYLDIAFQAYYMSKNENKKEENKCECIRGAVPTQPHTVSSGVIAMCGGDELRAALRRDGYIEDESGNMVDQKPRSKPVSKPCSRASSHAGWCTRNQPTAGGICTECWQCVNIKRVAPDNDAHRECVDTHTREQCGSDGSSATQPRQSQVEDEMNVKASIRLAKENARKMITEGTRVPRMWQDSPPRKDFEEIWRRKRTEQDSIRRNGCKLPLSHLWDIFDVDEYTSIIGTPATKHGRRVTFADKHTRAVRNPAPAPSRSILKGGIAPAERDSNGGEKMAQDGKEQPSPSQPVEYDVEQATETYKSEVLSVNPELVDTELLKEQAKKRDTHALISDGASHSDVQKLHQANVCGMLEFIRKLEKAGVEEPSLLRVHGMGDPAGGGDRQAKSHTMKPLAAPPKSERDARNREQMKRVNEFLNPSFDPLHPAHLSAERLPRVKPKRKKLSKSQREVLVALALGAGKKEQPVWGLLDSGANRHMIGGTSIKLSDVRKATGADRLITAGGDFISPVEIGRFHLRAIDPETKEELPPIELEDVSRFPSSPLNLISVSMLGQKGCKVNFGVESSSIEYMGRTFPIKHQNGLYFIRLDHILGADSPGLLRGLAALADTPYETMEVDGQTLAAAASLDLWHKRLGFEQKSQVKFMFDSGTVLGGDYKSAKGGNSKSGHGERCNCSSCRRFVPRRIPVSSERQIEEPVHKVGDRVSIDNSGPLVPSLHGGYRNMTVCVDHYSRWTHVFFTKSKSYDDILPCIRKLFDDYEKRGHKIREIKTDSGSEYGTAVDPMNSPHTLTQPSQSSLTPVEDRNTEFDALLRSKGCRHRLSPVRRAELNGTVESTIGALKRKAGAMLYHANLSAAFWPEAISYAVWLRNRTAIRAYKSLVTPSDLFLHVHPDLRFARVFGCDAFEPVRLDNDVKMSDEKRGMSKNLLGSPKTIRRIFMGMSGNRVGWRLYNPETRHFCTRYDVTFDEESCERRRDQLRQWDKQMESFKRGIWEKYPLINDDFSTFVKDPAALEQASDFRRQFSTHDDIQPLRVEDDDGSDWWDPSTPAEASDEAETLRVNENIFSPLSRDDGTRSHPADADGPIEDEFLEASSQQEASVVGPDATSQREETRSDRAMRRARNKEQAEIEELGTSIDTELMRVRFHPEKQYKGVELPLGKFAHDRESMLTQAQRHNVVRPLRTPPPKTKQVAQPADKEFLRTAEEMNFPIVWVPNPKIDGKNQGHNDSALRYDFYSQGATLGEARRIMCTTRGASKSVPMNRRNSKFSDDLLWDYERGFISFPGHEPLADAHYVDANALAKDNGVAVVGSIMSTSVNDDKEDLYSRAAQRFARHEDEHSAAECFMETLGMTPKGLRTALRAESEAKKRKADLSGRGDQLNSSTDPASDAEGNDRTEEKYNPLVDPEFLATEDPDGYKGILKLPAHMQDIWFESLKKEWESLLQFGAFEVVDISEVGNAKLFRTRWVLKKKYASDSTISKCKARLTAVGCSQRPGIDYDESATYASVLGYSSLRMLLSTACANNWRLDCRDISLAYIQSILPTPIYCELPDHYKKPGSCLKLKRGLYGLKQSAALWSRCMTDWLLSEEIGFRRMVSDPCLFYKSWEAEDLETGQKKQESVLLGLYVDDLTIASSSDEAFWWFDKRLRARFPVNPTEARRIRTITKPKAQPDQIPAGDTSLEPNLEDPKSQSRITDISKPSEESEGTGWILSLRIEYDQDRGILEIDQQQAIEKLAKKFGIDDSSELPATPLPSTIKLAPVDTAEMQIEEYLSVVGSLLHISQVSRPDIAHTVGLLARFGAKPGKAHYKAALGTVAYLYSTRERVIRYVRDPKSDNRNIPYIQLYSPGNDDLHVFVDADFAGKSEISARSTTGYLTTLNSGLTQWKSQLQRLTALSTSESECVALTEAIKEALSAKLFLEEIGMRDPSKMVTVHEDNKSTRDMALSDRAFQKARHYRTRVSFIQENCNGGDNQTVDLVQTPSERQLADGLTKTLDVASFTKFKDYVTCEPSLRTGITSSKARRGEGASGETQRSSGLGEKSSSGTEDNGAIAVGRQSGRNKRNSQPTTETGSNSGYIAPEITPHTDTITASSERAQTEAARANVAPESSRGGKTMFLGASPHLLPRAY